MKEIKTYQEYSIKDYLNDDEFILGQLMPTPQSLLYWEKVSLACPEQQENIARAVRILQSMKINDGYLSATDENALFEKIQNKHRKYLFRRRVYQVSSIAACFLILLALSFLLIPQEKPSVENLLSHSISTVKMDTLKDVQLSLGHKKTITMAEDMDINLQKNKVTVNGRTTHSTLSSLIDEDDETYNTLRVPYGKRSFLALNDGTKVWVNSGTEVRFPTQMNGKERRIFIDGEAYLEVAHNTERPFYVQTSDLNVRVYGTKFNITAYKQDKEKSVVLLEGKVAVFNKAESQNMTFLNPNQRYSKTRQGFSVEQVNAYQYVTWKDGIWEFTSHTLDDIALRLSRYYGREIHCDPSVASKACTGKLILFDDINRTLETIARIFSVQYTINDTKINISNPLKAQPMNNK